MTSYSYVHLRERVTVMPSKSADGGVFVNLAGTDCGVHVQAAVGFVEDGEFWS